MKDRGYNRRKVWERFQAIWISMGVLAIIILIVWYVSVSREQLFPVQVQAQVDLLPDRRAKEGTLHETEGRTLAEGDFWVVLNQIPIVEPGARECSLEYENPKANVYSARVNLYLKSTGELLGGTRRVDPGNYVETVELEKMLEPGDYPVTALIELFEKKEPVGGLSLDITLHVEKQDGGEAE